MGKTIRRQEVKFIKDFHNEPSGIYLYLHRKSTDGSVFYVGKGTGDRYRSTNRTNSHWQNTAIKHGVTVEIIDDNLQEWYAYEREVELIAYYGRSDLNQGYLVNQEDGGSGGKKNHIEIYEFNNYKTNEVLKCTKQQFKSKIGFHPYKLINTKDYHRRGWYLIENLTEEKVEILRKGLSRFKPTVYNFINFKTGQKLSTTISEFKNLTNVNPAHILAKRKNSNHGWTTEEILNSIGLDKLMNPFSGKRKTPRTS